MADGDTPHHIGLPDRPERRPAALLGLDRDQPVDDLAALDQQFVHGLVDPVDIDTERRQIDDWTVDDGSIRGFLVCGHELASQIGADGRWVAVLISRCREGKENSGIRASPSYACSASGRPSKQRFS
jgi:hypothetical protein